MTLKIGNVIGAVMVMTGLMFLLVFTAVFMSR